MRLMSTIGSVVLTLSACMGADDSDLQQKLASESRTNGLALAAAIGDEILVIPFDGPERHFQAEHRFSILTIGKSGQMVSWWFRKQDFFTTDGEFVVNSVGGQAISRTISKIAGFRPIALSDSAERIAFWAGHDFATEARPLYWSSLDLSNPVLINNQTGEPDWSPDGSALVYAREGKIYIFDIANRSSRYLADGHDPTWSPNGKWIGFVAPDGHASLVTTAGEPQTWSMSQHRPISPMRWSPSGDFVSFTEKLPTMYALLDAVAKLVVSRVSDGKALTIRTLGSESVTSRAFYWITGYRGFCSKCTKRD
jgi:hypothetical protein